MEKLEHEARWFLSVVGKKGFPFIRFYLRPAISEALKTNTPEEVTALLRRVGADFNLNTEGWV